MKFDDFLESLVRLQYVTGHDELEDLLEDFVSRFKNMKSRQGRPVVIGTSIYLKLRYVRQKGDISASTRGWSERLCE